MIRTVQALALLSLVSVVGCGASDALQSPEYKAACDAELKIYDEMLEAQLATFNVKDESELSKHSTKLDSLFEKLERHQLVVKNLRPKTPNSKEYMEANSKVEDLHKRIDEKTEEMSKLRSGNPAKESMLREIFAMRKQAVNEAERRARCNPNP